MGSSVRRSLAFVAFACLVALVLLGVAATATASAAVKARSSERPLRNNCQAAAAYRNTSASAGDSAVLTP